MSKTTPWGKLARTLTAFGVATLLAFPASAESTRGEILIAQMKLDKLGMDIGKPDGKAGPATRSALAQAGEKYGFEPTLDAFYTHFTLEVEKGTKPLEQADLIEAVKEKVGDQLKDPFSAQYKDLRTLPSGKVCGKVNAKNSYGAYVGWTTFATYGSPFKTSDQRYLLAIHLDNGDSELASLLCLIDG